MAVRVKRSPSQLLLPLAFGAHAGSLLALTGTPVNVIVSDAAADAGVGRFGFFEFALVGVPLVLGTIAIVALFGERLLPIADRADDRSGLQRSRAHAGAPVRARARCAAHAPHRRRRGGDPAAVGADRQRGLPGMVTDSGDLIVLAVQRAGETLGPGDIELAEGDVLLLRGTWAALDEQLDDPSVLVVDSPALVRRQAIPLGQGAKRALVVLAAMVALLVTGAVPAAVAGLLAACAIVLLGLLTTEQAYRSVSWTTVLLIGGMMSLSAAMVSSGAAETLADELVEVVADSGGYALLGALFLLTAALGQVISNMATALIVIPIAVSAAADMDISAKPVLMAVTVSAAAAFLTPVATPANLMVEGPGGYRFGDYWKLGLPLLVLFGLVAVLLVPVFWRF